MMQIFKSIPENMEANLYLPSMGTITQTHSLTRKEKWYEIQMPETHSFSYKPGQFVEVSLFGVGEAPISITSAMKNPGLFEMTIRDVGVLTENIHALNSGDLIGIRGPFGNGFDLKKFKGKDVLIVAGGIGLVPLRSLIHTILNDRKSYGRLIILYGTKSSQDLLYKSELDQWETHPGIEFQMTVDQPSPDWHGIVGVITTLIPSVTLDLENTVAAIVGPPVMYKFVLLSLLTKGLSDENIYLSLERRMKCGVGKCGHCQINHSLVCQDGPVYHYPELKKLQEAL